MVGPTRGSEQGNKPCLGAHRPMIDRVLTHCQHPLLYVTSSGSDPVVFASLLQSMRPATKRERDIKCVQVQPRKRVKSASPDVRAGTDDTHKRPKLLACPYYKHDPTRHMDCLLRNRLTSTSFVRQHLQRAHVLPIHCPCCGDKFRKEADRNDHVREARCTRKSFAYRGLSEDQVTQIRTPPRDLDERVRWNSMWKILFPGEPCPDDPHVGSAQEEILGIARRAVEAASPYTSPEVLQILNWDAVSSIYTSRSIDKTSPPSSQNNWPSTPESMCSDTSEATMKPLVRQPRAPRVKFTAVPTVPALDNEFVIFPDWQPFFPSDDANCAVGETQRPLDFPFYELPTPSSTPLSTGDLFVEFNDEQQAWLPWHSPTMSLPALSSLPISSNCGFSPLAGTEVIDLTQ